MTCQKDVKLERHHILNMVRSRPARPRPRARSPSLLTRRPPRLALPSSHHPQPNLHVINALLSLKSKGHLREVFNWQWHYFFLTETGVTYLREYLHLPEDVVPATLKKPAAKPLGLGAEASGPAGRFGNRTEGGRSGGFGDKGGAPGAGFRTRFEGGEGGYRKEGGFGAPRA